MRRRLLIATCVAACLAVVAPATARAPKKLAVTGFELLQVNQEVFRVKPGGSHPLCQAIPLTAIRARVKWSGARKNTKATLLFTVPRHKARSRAITLRTTSGTRLVEFSPRSERLDDEAFPGGRYKVSLRSGGRSFKAAMVTLTQATTTC